MPKRDFLSSDVKPAGESWVWVTSMGLGVGLTMIVFLLGMILWNGLEVFWPKPVVQLELRPGSTAGLNNAPVFGGEIVKSQIKAVQVRADADAGDEPPQREYQLFVGNKDIYGFGYKFIDHAEIAGESRPADVIVAERLEYGNAIFRPKELRLADGTVLPAAATAFDRTLAGLVRESNDRRAAIRRIERDEIGAINRQLEKIRLERRALENKGPLVSPADQRRLADFDAAVADLQARYEKLAAKARELRGLQSVNRIAYTTMDGAERTLPTGDLIDYYRPNQLTVLNKAGIFAHRFWKFLSDEPREANTEGGIFPAIFGTFVMTLLMSVAVTPFGVLAAIYLREYAKQGPFVRAVRIAVNNLAGVPSIVFGVFGLGFFVYVVGGTIDQLFYSLSLPTPTFGLRMLFGEKAGILVASQKVASELDRGVIVCILCDRGDRYLSSDLFAPDHASLGDEGLGELEIV